ncbi:serine/threonine-protein kinase [Haliangium sp.]|uniref:serine/threonine-protein kinase n=1 Tax=Haliangium sp. TaxID=2663208 RepID=UPI003D0A7C8F
MSTPPPVRELYGDILAPGASLGEYVIEELAFEGGFASVYRGRRRDGRGEPVAIKVLRGHLALSLRMIERFEQEAAALERLEHPRIVTTHGLGQLPDGRPYIVMEWIEGRSLAQELAARGPLAAADALAVMNEIGDAVAAAHAIGVVHRDLKAQNIIAVPQGGWFTVKLIDFGIAKMTAPQDQHTAFTTRTMIGTPRTMAPEQIQGRSVNERTDIYALGLLYYLMVTGRLPFDGSNTVEIEQLHLHAAPPPASRVAPVPAAVDAVLARALAKEKQDRYPDVATFLAELAHAVGDGSASAPAPAPTAGAEAPAPSLHLGIALLVEIGGGGDDGDGEVDDIGDVLFAELDHELAALDLPVPVETIDMVLAATPLPEDVPTAERCRRRVLAAALRIRAAADRALAENSNARPVTVAVRTGELALDGTGAVVAGSLLDDDAWAGCRGRPGVVADHGVVAGLGPKPRRRAVPGQPELVELETPKVQGPGTSPTSS